MRDLNATIVAGKAGAQDLIAQLEGSANLSAESVHQSNIIADEPCLHARMILVYLGGDTANAFRRAIEVGDLASTTSEKMGKLGDHEADDELNSWAVAVFEAYRLAFDAFDRLVEAQHQQLEDCRVVYEVAGVDVNAIKARVEVLAHSYAASRQAAEPGRSRDL